MSDQGITATSFLGVLLGIISLTILRITQSGTFSWHNAVKRIIANPNDTRNFGPDQFAQAVLKRDKEVFEKLAEL